MEDTFRNKLEMVNVMFLFEIKDKNEVANAEHYHYLLICDK